jgi:hypothetical protein
MKREEAMKNLWMVSPASARRPFFHNSPLGSGAFTPISKGCQAVDPIRPFEVIPLPTVSY